MSDPDFDLDAMLNSILNGEPALPAPSPTMTAPLATTVTVAVTKEDTDGGVFTDSPDRLERDIPAIAFPEFTTSEIASTLDIRNYATMARLRIRKWHARVKDKRVARDTAHAEGASDQAFSVYKKLLAGAEEKLKKVHSVIDSARMRHYEMTLPWSTTGVDETGRRDGPRLLANTLFMEYVSAMGQAKIDAETALDDFVEVYPALIEVARQSLGRSFDETQYPPPTQIRDRFALDFDFQPIPTGVDFKGLPQQQIDALKARMDHNMRQCLENAMRDVWQRLHEVVAHMAERLGDPNKTFHDTLVTNVRGEAALAKHLNATGDAKLAKLVSRIESDLCVHDADMLRKNTQYREYTAQCARDILNFMDKAGRNG
jgi:hypothetical protein